MNFDREIFINSFPELINAAGVTIQYTFISVIVGSVLAVFLTLGLRSSLLPIKKSVQFYIYFFRGSPLLVQIFLFYFGAGQFSAQLESIGLWVLFREAWFCAYLALSLNTSAYTANILDGALRAIPQGEIEATQALGFGPWQGFFLLQLPRAFRTIIPAYGNEVILLLKATSLVSTITIMDLLGVARRIASETFAPIEVFVAAGLIYLLMTALLTLTFSLVERQATAFQNR